MSHETSGVKQWLRTAAALEPLPNSHERFWVAGQPESHSFVFGLAMGD
jgi:hypothetical protein